MLKNLAKSQKIEQADEDFKVEKEIKSKYDLPDVKQIDVELQSEIANVEPEERTEKLKLFYPYVEPVLQTAEEIEIDSAPKKTIVPRLKTKLKMLKKHGKVSTRNEN